MEEPGFFPANKLESAPIIRMKRKIHHHRCNDGSLSIPLALHHYSQSLFCAWKSVLQFFVFNFGHRLKFPLLFTQQVVFSATFCPSSLFTALQVKTDLGAVLICIAVLSLWYQKHLCESETLRPRAEHWWLSLSESKYSPGWCYLRTTPGAFDHDDIWVTRHVAHHSSHSTCTVYIHGCGTIEVKVATVVGTVSPVCLLCLTSAMESAEESFREP